MQPGKKDACLQQVSFLHLPALVRSLFCFWENGQIFAIEGKLFPKHKFINSQFYFTEKRFSDLNLV